MEAYNPNDVTRSYHWLGHQAYTEVSAYHPQYRPGKENRAWNDAQYKYPMAAYIRSDWELIAWVERYAGERMVCYGINERPQPCWNTAGWPQSARENDILISQNLLFDLDLKHQFTPSHNHAAEQFLEHTREYFLDHGFLPPVRAFTGQGYHLLFAYPSISVLEHPDISQRIKAFRNEFQKSHKQELDGLELQLDNTQDLRRMVKIYGTAKPTVGITSKFYGTERREDEKLREYLLGLQLPPTPHTTPSLRIGDQLPEWFNTLLNTDQQLRNLWSGQGKPEGTDTSRSGYDFSITKRLLGLGHRDLDQIASILWLRPDGAVKASGKREDYIKRTIANALIK